MVEGKIGLDFGARARPVDVEKDQQVVLDSIALDAAGRIISLPSNIVPTDIPASIKASLALSQQQLLEAATVINFPAMTTQAAPQQAYPQPNGTTGTNADGTTSATSSTGNPESLPLSPVPPATAPATRTTPGDGRL
jgi:hypothetical protein